jgi:hypothetical protein
MLLAGCSLVHAGRNEASGFEPPRASGEIPVQGDASAGKQGETPAAPSANQLSNQAANPNSPLTQVQLRNITAPRLPGYEGTGNELQLQAVVPIQAHELLPFATITKITIPVATLPEPVDQTALGPIQLFSQAVFGESWGTWGVGFTVTAPTDTFDDVPEGTWQLGPAAAIIYTGVDDLVIGGVFQQSVSLSTPPEGEGANELTFTPSITYSLPEGWFVGYPDLDWTLDWKNDADFTFPVGLQVGKVIQIGGQPFAASLQAGYNVVRPTDGTGVPRWMIGVELTALFPAL